MKRVGGYVGKLLRINLTNLKVSIQELDYEIARKFIGGSGYAAKILYDNLTKDISPYSPDNLLIFMTGPLTGSTVPGGARWSVVALSPLTGVFGEGNAGGFWGTQLKRDGYDGIIFYGRAKSPVYLFVRDGEAQLKKASSLWGMDTYDSCRVIQSELGESDVQVACIGPAGERLVRMACIVCNHRGAVGRTGLGAVMGSKNLKAVAVRGSQNVHLIDGEKTRKLSLEVIKATKMRGEAYDPRNLGRDGTAFGLTVFNEVGNLPTKNWNKGVFGGAEKISGPTMSKDILAKRLPCFMCTIACGRYVEVKTGPYAPLSGRGPEYETLASFGSLCLNDNLESIAKANDLCNRFGIDTISCGASIAYAMECFERGIIGDNELGDLKLTWGNCEAIIRMVELIGKKEGFGAVLGEGVRIAAQRIGKGGEDCALHVKGLELPMHNPRAFKSMGLAYATSNRGACHNQGSPMYVERGILLPEYGLNTRLDGTAINGKAYLTMVHQNICSAIDATGMCKFYVLLTHVVPINLLLEYYSAVTGWLINPEELLEIGERIWNLKRIINVRRGVSRKDDTLPKRFIEDKVQDGPVKGQIVELEPMLREYYELRGWTQEGKPTKKKLDLLGLD